MPTPPTPALARDRLATWRESVKSNFFELDPHVQALVRIYRPEAASLPTALREFGEQAAREMDDLARTTNQGAALPILDRYDGFGRRTEGIRFHPDYHTLGRLVAKAGILARYDTPGQELESLFLTYLLAHDGEAGHGCPVACAAGMIRLLEGKDVPGTWLPGLRSRDYDLGLRASQFLTEIQGGSDVGAGAVRAEQDESGTWRLWGEKWFCSVIDADLFLVTARVGGGPGTDAIRGFVVPRELDDGSTNLFAVRRLKDKLGTRSMASAEVDFQGALGVSVAPFKEIVDVVLNTSRLYNATFCCGSMQRSFLEARAYARSRQAFGQPILAFPPIARLVADMNARAWGARSVTFFLADLRDRMTVGRASEEEALAFRALVNLNKVWTAIRTTRVSRDGIEVLGGNGAIEDFSVLPRLLRDAIVCEAWEGGHNVLFAQVLRDSARLEVHRALLAVLQACGGANLERPLARISARIDRLLADPAVGALHARDVLFELEPIAQAALLTWEVAQGGPALGAVAAEHLLVTGEPSYDALEDRGLSARVAALSA